MGFLPGELDNFAADPDLLQEAQLSFLGKMLEKWIDWAWGDSKGSNNFATLNELRLYTLRDAGLRANAHDLQLTTTQIFYLWAITM